MSVELVSCNFADRFDELIKSTESELRIISPFIGYRTACKLADFLSGNQKVKCKIITRFYREDFIQQVSSIEGLKRLYEVGVEIFALVGLHTKLYIFDNVSAIIGSANFTAGGFYTNHELSVLVDEEEEIAQECIEHFDELWGRIEECGGGKVSDDWLEEEIKQVNKIGKNRGKKSKNINTARKGAVLSKEPWALDSELPKIDSVLNKKDLLEEILSKQVLEDDSSVWLKFIGKSTQRLDGDSYFYEAWKDNDCRRIYFNRRPLSIKDNAIVYEVALSYDNNGKPSPMILGRAIAYAYKKENEVTEVEKEAVPWKKEYPYYLELKESKYINSTIKEALPLDDLYSTLGNRVYPSTALKQNATRQDVNLIHKQKSHLRITEMARQYLDEELEKYFNKYGCK